MSGRHRSDAAPDMSGPMDPTALAGSLAASPLERQAAEALRQVLRARPERAA